uniref:RING-type domain-containing protein n=1 Tax=Globisporangium ultimum (strain ATCC 200006 / CBS 805.95 / DAOM BR144) TaxID=431595 RepID=K3X559_GLOUD
MSLSSRSQQPAASTRKRNSLAAVLPASIAWLDPLSLSMKVASPSKAARHRHHPHHNTSQQVPKYVHYQLTLQHKSASGERALEWSLSRPYDEYRAFQKRLLKLMQHGHFCSAECPWLYTFVKSYFPKKTYFASDASCTRLAEKRRESLLRCLSALQTFLLNRTNHGCGVVVDTVATELLQFVLQDEAKDHPLKRQLFSSDGSFSRFSSDSMMSTTSDEEETGSSTEFEGGLCTLCESSLDGEPSSNSDSTESMGNQSQNSVYSSGNSSSSYTTTLSCGHQFHDECIIPKLNESMQCPTCGAKQSSHA